MMFSNLVYPAATVYPDSDKIGIWTDRDSPTAIWPGGRTISTTTTARS